MVKEDVGGGRNTHRFDAISIEIKDEGVRVRDPVAGLLPPVVDGIGE